ncbi:hypothetical protein AYO38_09595 [bacterium SCGC AG-212-C10]|nr:hypothetical protein AYO38_09595 [bacterium SCGC AG-212-C10]
MGIQGLLPWLVININIDPTIGTAGPFTLTWHGLFTAVGIIAGVTLSVWLAKRDGIPTEIGQEIALVGVPSAIIGARLFYVFEHWDRFSGSWDNYREIVFGITEGGITLYGGLLGGVIGGVIYAALHKWPIPIILDAAAPGMVLGQALGRVGDLINGEHHADASSLPWAVKYTNPNTLGELGKAVHPTAGGYELLGDLIICGLLLWVLSRWLKAPGWIFCAYVALYGTMRFFLSFTRTNTGAGGEQVYFGVPVPQIVAGVTVGLAIIMAGYFLRHPGKITKEYADRVGWEPKDKDLDAKPGKGQPAGV